MNYNNLTLQREYIMEKVFTNLGLHKELAERWKKKGFVKPVGWQRRLFAFFLILFISSCGNKYKYDEGMHWSYKIICENGFVYKATNKGIIQILNTDGKPLKCGEKAY